MTAQLAIHRTARYIAPLLTSWLLMTGCSVDAGESNEPDEVLMVDNITWARPEIGFFPGLRCTGTLIAPNVVVTAAHCLHYCGEYVGVPINQVTKESFVIHDASGNPTSFPVAQKVCMSTDAQDVAVGGRLDVAVVKLGAAVPVSVAWPATVYPYDPADYEFVELWGYGCRNAGELPDGYKRTNAAQFFGSNTTLSRILCEGDSGGPLTDAAGRVIGINARYYATPPRDAYAMMNRPTSGGGSNYGFVSYWMEQFTLPVGGVNRLEPHPGLGGIAVYGYAAQPDYPDVQSKVHVYIDGQFGQEVITYGQWHEYGAWLWASPGSHAVCAYGIDHDGDGYSNLGCFSVYL